MGQRATVTGVNFRSGYPSTLGEKVASGLILRFGTIDCVNDNLACFKDGLGDSGSFLDVGGHRFYVAITKPFPEEVTDMSNPLYNAGSSCSESSDLGTMVNVLALGDEEGGDSSRAVCPPLECLLPPEQAAPLPEQDIVDDATMNLCTPLDRAIDPVQVAEALEQTRIALLGKAADIEDTRHRVSSTLHEFYATQGLVLVGEACDVTTAPCCGSKQASGAAGIAAKSRPSGARPNQLRSEQERWKSPHPAVRQPWPTPSRPSSRS
jgi:hypothetical protein